MKVIYAAIIGLLVMTTAAAADQKRAVLENYANLAFAVYEDSLNTARAMQGAIKNFLAKPTEANLQAARKAWIAARVPYQQSEVYRFGNAVVDDWEGRKNPYGEPCMLDVNYFFALTTIIFVHC